MGGGGKGGGGVGGRGEGGRGGTLKKDRRGWNHQCQPGVFRLFRELDWACIGN